MRQYIIVEELYNTKYVMVLTCLSSIPIDFRTQPLGTRQHIIVKELYSIKYVIVLTCLRSTPIDFKAHPLCICLEFRSRR